MRRKNPNIIYEFVNPNSQKEMEKLLQQMISEKLLALHQIPRRNTSS